MQGLRPEATVAQGLVELAGADLGAAEDDRLLRLLGPEDLDEPVHLLAGGHLHVRLLDRFSFVELDAAHAEQALERLEGTKLKGKQIRVEYARG